MPLRRTTLPHPTSNLRRRFATGPRVSTWASEDMYMMTISVLTRAARYAPVLLVSLIAACGLLDTEQPNIIDPGTINSPEGAQSLRNGAIADFGFVKDGDGTQFDDGLILLSGLLTDEFVHSTTPPSEQEIDQRTTALLNPNVSDV